MILWQPRHRTATDTGTPSAKSQRSKRAIGTGIEKIALDRTALSWRRPDSSGSEEGCRDGRPRNQYKSPSKLSHLGERVRRFRPEWRPVPLAELYRKQHEKEQEVRRLQLEPIGIRNNAEQRRRRETTQGTQRLRKQQKAKPAEPNNVSVSKDAATQ